VSADRHLTFVSSRFLFPADSGGKIRTSQILRGLKNGAFKVRLLMPCRDPWRQEFASEIESVCDQLVSWEPCDRSNFMNYLRKISWLARRLPVPVVSDWSAAAEKTVGVEIARKPDVVVFDFPHSAVLAPPVWDVPSVMFTHNVEAEIFERHWKVAGSPWREKIWRNQHRKMLAFEREALARFDTVIAVSDRDSDFFRSQYGVECCRTIPTGVDTDFFEYHAPENRRQVVFCGSMDWMANIDGIEYFFKRVWPSIRERVPDARMKVVGRTPPESLVRRIERAAGEWEFTGFVDDVRPHISGADVFVIPLRVGGGTRIKAFEAMAMGCPVVSTAIGIEGLPVEDGRHFLCADTADLFARQVAMLLLDRDKSRALSASGRRLVAEQFGYRQAAAAFEAICLDTLARETAAVRA